MATKKELQHIVSVSGGKDSTALYLLALQRLGVNGFRAVFCDTGHEHQLTYDYVRNLHSATGGPKVEFIHADFTERLKTRATNLQKFWEKDGVPQERIDAVKRMIKPTGNPFLDLCILKGRFPSTRARFCTEELKVEPFTQQIALPALRQGSVLHWRGIRRDESKSRENAKKFERGDFGLRVFQPLVDWSAEDVFAMHKKHSLEPNPLYMMGFGRVGCMPCIMCTKSEMAEISTRFPSEVARVREWERLVAKMSKRGRGTFFANDKIPHEGSSGVTIDQVADWSKTSRGGRQYDLFFEPTDVGECSSLYGLCE
jgi:3'-phosphoadenosine 5'-phosphosulfate sulfotransferase (PAPS reductase)/FAD synthetase